MARRKSTKLKTPPLKRVIYQRSKTDPDWYDIRHPITNKLITIVYRHPIYRSRWTNSDSTRRHRNRKQAVMSSLNIQGIEDVRA